MFFLSHLEVCALLSTIFVSVIRSDVFCLSSMILQCLDWLWDLCSNSCLSFVDLFEKSHSLPKSEVKRSEISVGMMRNGC